jgi:uncharacterized protein (DUF1810 family)
MPTDPFNLQRFLDAQEATYEQALGELRAGHKRSHWSWYIFPQVAGLGSSRMSVLYAIKSLEEAKAYMAHPVLGLRLRECVAAMNSHAGIGAEEILGRIDATKLQSCLTLFAQADGSEPAFREGLDKYFHGQPDATTLAILARQRGAQAKHSLP